MAPKLRVLISSGSSYPPKTELSVNNPKPTPLKTADWDGEISVWVKGFEGDKKGGDGHEYFDVRTGMTYAIVARGKFKEDVEADELLFGNIFDRPIRDNLPWGTSIATKAMYFVEPSLELDLYADKPWGLSYALASLNHLSLTKEKKEGAVINEDSVDLLNEVYDGAAWYADSGLMEDYPLDSGGDEKARAATRKRWMSYPENRQAVTLSKDTYYGMEFCNGYLDFNTLSLSLPAQFNMSFNLLKYWDGQPVTYVCAKKGADGKLPGGKVYWSVAFEIVDESAKADLEKRGGAPLGETSREGEEAEEFEKSGGASDDDVD